LNVKQGVVSAKKDFPMEIGHSKLDIRHFSYFLISNIQPACLKSISAYAHQAVRQAPNFQCRNENALFKELI